MTTIKMTPGQTARITTSDGGATQTVTIQMTAQQLERMTAIGEKVLDLFDEERIHLIEASHLLTELLCHNLQSYPPAQAKEHATLLCKTLMERAEAVT